MSADVIKLHDDAILTFVCPCQNTTFHVQSNGLIVCASCDEATEDASVLKWVNTQTIVEHPITPEDPRMTCVTLTNRPSAQFMLKRCLDRVDEVLYAFAVMKDGYLSTYRKAAPEGQAQKEWAHRKLADGVRLMTIGDEDV